MSKYFTRAFAIRGTATALEYGCPVQVWIGPIYVSIHTYGGLAFWEGTGLEDDPVSFEVPTVEIEPDGSEHFAWFLTLEEEGRSDTSIMSNYWDGFKHPRQCDCIMAHMMPGPAHRAGPKPCPNYVAYPEYSTEDEGG